MFLIVSSVQGFFANPEIGGAAGVFYKLPGQTYTNGEQLGWQFVGVALTIGYTVAVSTILLLLLKMTIGINNPKQPEVEEIIEEKAPPAPSTLVQPMYMVPGPYHPLYPAMAQPFGTMAGYA